MGDRWTELSEAVLAGCLRGDRKKAIEIIYANNVTIHDITNVGLYREIFLGIVDVLETKDGVPSPISVSTANHALSDKIDAMRKLASINVSDLESSNAAKIIRSESSRDYIKSLLVSTLKDFDKHDDIEELRGDLLESLNHRAGINKKETTTKAIVEEIEAGMSGYGVAYPTGFKWLDHHLKGGLRPGRHIAIGGGEKSRKTTWLRNIIKNILRKPTYSKTGDFLGYKTNDRVSVCFLGFENDRFITTMDFTTMLAAEFMRSNYKGMMNEKFGDRYYHEWLDAELMIDALANKTLGKLPSEIKESMEFGLDAIKKLNLTINDTTEDGGDLDTMTDMKRVIGYHNATYRTDDQLLVICTDYLTLVNVTGITDERVAQNMVVKWLTRESPNLKACMITLAQFNRSNVYSRMNNEEVDVMGTHGSSELERAVQNYMDVATPSATMLNVRMRRARRGSAGIDESQSYYIHPASGVIMGAKQEGILKITGG